MNKLSIVETHPEIVARWDYNNNNQSPSKYTYGSEYAVMWICRDCGISYKNTIKSQIRCSRHTCKKCGHKQGSSLRTQKIADTKGSLAVVRPDIAAQWHPTKNGTLTPNNVSCGSSQKVWWYNTNCGHEWDAIIINRVNGCGCGICSPSRKRTEEEATLNDSINNIIRLSKYTGNDDLTTYLCPKCTEPFQTRPHDVWAGKVSQCEQCRLSNMGGQNRLTEKEAQERDDIAGWKRLEAYVDNDTLTLYICPLCNSQFRIRPDSVWTGNAKSCGCIQKGKPALNRKDRTGQKYHHLTALRYLRTECNRPCHDHQCIWEFKCDCGQIIEADGCAVESGNTTSCGCIKSRGNNHIAKLLNKFGIKYYREQSFDWCKNTATNRKLFFDFYIPSHNLLIEYQGDIHYKSGNGWNTPESLIERQRKDQIKRDCCALRIDIRYVEIPYTEYDNIEEILRRELDIPTEATV